MFNNSLACTICRIPAQSSPLCLGWYDDNMHSWPCSSFMQENAMVFVRVINCFWSLAFYTSSLFWRVKYAKYTKSNVYNEAMYQQEQFLDPSNSYASVQSTRFDFSIAASFVWVVRLHKLLFFLNVQRR